MSLGVSRIKSFCGPVLWPSSFSGPLNSTSPSGTGWRKHFPGPLYLPRIRFRRPWAWPNICHHWTEDLEKPGSSVARQGARSHGIWADNRHQAFWHHSTSRGDRLPWSGPTQILELPLLWTDQATAFQPVWGGNGLPNSPVLVKILGSTEATTLRTVNFLCEYIEGLCKPHGL